MREIATIGRPQMRYVNMKQHWRRCGPIAKSEYARQIWLPDMAEYQAIVQLERLMISGSLCWDVEYSNPKPVDFDESDWRFRNKGRGPSFWDYFAHGASHWLVNLNLFLASTTMPTHPWRIVGSECYSTVWNGDNLLFDLNFLALGPPASTAWGIAAEHPTSKHLAVGESLPLIRWSRVVDEFAQGLITKRRALNLRFGRGRIPKRFLPAEEVSQHQGL